MAKNDYVEVDPTSQGVRAIIHNNDLDFTLPRLMVLEIIGTLVYCELVSEYKDGAPPKDATKIDNYYVWKRPHLDSFLRFCVNNYEIAIWSMIPFNTSEKLVEFAFGRYYPRVCAIFDSNQCTILHKKVTTGGSNGKPVKTKEFAYLIKDLEYIWSSCDAYTEENTVIIDTDTSRLMESQLDYSITTGFWEGDPHDEVLSRKGELVRLLTPQ